MTKKELKAMNGEVKSYRLNEPMTWEEFKKPPDDIKVTYIKLLREEWGVPDSHIAEMMGIGKCSISLEMTRLNLNGGRKARDYKWDAEGFKAWVHGVPVVEDEPVQVVKDDSRTAIPEAVIEEPVPEENACVEVVEDATPARAIPCNGSMVFEGKAEDVLKTIGVLLGGANVHISVTWDVL
jgi:hypothetical protein